VLNGRIYRAAFVPFAFAVVIAGFSLGERPGPLASNLAPDAFDGARAFSELESLAAQYPERRPGGPGDEALASHVVGTLRQLGGTAAGGFSVAVRHPRGQTIDGERTLTTVIAERPGTTGAAPIVILAHRDAATNDRRRSKIGQQIDRQIDQAQLSATAVLLELARVFAASETQRTIVLVSTSGGSGGDVGAADFAAHAGEPAGGQAGGSAGGQAGGSAGGQAGGSTGGSIDAAIVLGDLASEPPLEPVVVPFSDGLGAAPALLQSTVSAAIAQGVGTAPASPGGLSQLVHLAFPFAAGEQGPLNARGLPAVLVGVGGEQREEGDGGRSRAREPVSAGRLEVLGRGVLAAVYALDAGPDVASVTRGSEAGLPIQRKVLPEWVLRLLVGTLLLPPLLVALDGLARLRRRREPVARWALWTLACALPFLVCALLAILLGALGAIAAPRPPVSPGALPFDGPALEAALATVLALVLAWLAWPAATRRLGLPVRPAGEGLARPAAAIAMLLVLTALAAVVWAVNPFTALLLVPALHLWLVLATPEQRPAGRVPFRAPALAAVALGLVPLALLVAFYAHQFDLGLGGVAHTALLLLAGGRIGLVGAALWSVAFGCLAAALLIALAAARPPGGDREADIDDPGGWVAEQEAIAIRGPLSYAGPGSLGGTDSALRR
jgi:hypothetical protein